MIESLKEENGEGKRAADSSESHYSQRAAIRAKPPDRFRKPILQRMSGLKSEQWIIRSGAASL